MGLRRRKRGIVVSKPLPLKAKLLIAVIVIIVVSQIAAVIAIRTGNIDKVEVVYSYVNKYTGLLKK